MRVARGHGVHSMTLDELNKLASRQFIHYVKEQMSRLFDSVQLGSIELFCKAAERGGFTAAAQALGLTPAAVSRSIARLEARLGVRLFVRTTRSIRLTPEGEVYQAQCRQALDQIAEAERALSGGQLAASGLLRVSVGTVYAHHRLLPLLPRFTAAHPGVALELDIANRNIDFVEDGFDVAIRLGEPADSRLIARKLEDAELGVYASPDYLKRRGEPFTLVDLTGHDLIQFVRPSSGRAMPWTFKDAEGRDTEHVFESRYRVQEDVLGCVGWAAAGGGLFQIYRFVAEEAVRAGRLVEVLKDVRGGSRPFSILYPHHRHLSGRVRAFVDFCVDTVGSGEASS